MSSFAYSVGSVLSRDLFYEVALAATRMISDWRARLWINSPVEPLENDRKAMIETIQLCLDHTRGVPMDDLEDMMECRDFLYFMRYTETCWLEKCNGDWIKRILKDNRDVPLSTPVAQSVTESAAESVMDSLPFVRGC